MEKLWSISTTIREGERIIGFLETAKKIDGLEWNKETQCLFQILLIKNHKYLQDIENPQVRNLLNEEQIAALSAWDKEMSLEMARSIFERKNYEDPPMRGRQSMSPLVKLGLVFHKKIENKNFLYISDMGNKLLKGEIQFEDTIREALLKHQYPNPSDSGFKNWNIKPFICTLHLIKEVNDLCKHKGLKAKGISNTEFGIFSLSLKSYRDVKSTAKRIIEFRDKINGLKKDSEKKDFIKNFIKDYLSEFNNPIKNCEEYSDNMIRYLRLTKYIYIRGKYDNTYIDLEPRRLLEISSILENDSGKPINFSEEEWIKYMGTYGTYILPFETFEKLSEIANEIISEINSLEKDLNIEETLYSIPNNVSGIKSLIKDLRKYRTKLQNLELKKEVHQDIGRVDETIEVFKNIISRNTSKLVKKLPVELEKWTNVALNIINDANLIKPNYPVGDDNEPIFTAPNGVPDIECFYDNFSCICEVTMLTSRDQWFNEGQPVMRHLRDFEIKHSETPSYCLFIAPSIHKDTINTFYTSVKYEYEGRKQKIIPITIAQLISVLELLKSYILNDKEFNNKILQELLDKCSDMSQVSNSTAWLPHINDIVTSWEKQYKP